MRTRVVLLAGLVFFVFSNAMADDWQQFRGLKRYGMSKETGLLKEWAEGGPKLVWQMKEAPEGWGGPAVVGDVVYLIGNRGMEEESLTAYKVSDGAQVWSTKIGVVGKPNQN